jgi:hypothetical protein
MAKLVDRLTALVAARKTTPGFYPDGKGLHLKIGPTGAKSWALRYTLRGRTRWMGLGPCDLVSLAEARERALQARRQRYEGVDPIDARRATRAAARAAEREAIAKTMTFAACADAYFADHQAGWRNADHRTQWSSSVATYVAPIIGHLPVQTIDTALVLKVLKQPVPDGIFWTALPETAARVRGRIEAVLGWARAHRFCEGENPARWRGHLAELLPHRKKLARVVHLPALPYVEMPAFMARLRTLDGNAARALEFSILTAARRGVALFGLKSI